MARTAGSSAEVTGPRIREAALRLFARHGFDAVSMRQIAAEVGVRAGTLYLYTPDKETLLVDLLTGHMRALIADYDAEAPPGNARVRLAHFVGFHIGQNLDHRDQVFLSYMELRSLGRENFAAIEQLRRAYEGRLDAILAEGQAASLFLVPDLRLATRAIIAMLNGVNTWFRDGGPLSRDEVGRIYREMVLRSVAA